MDLSKYSNDELIALYHKYDSEEIINDNMQMSLKILLNSGYGAIGNAHFLYYRVENAEAITSFGQLINKWTSFRINDYLNEVFETSGVQYHVAGDTDSFYVSLAPLMQAFDPDWSMNKKVDFIDDFCKTVMSPIIKEYCAELAEYMNSRKNAMKWEREVIAEKAIWVAKKKYCMDVWDSEGTRYSPKPKTKLTGLEAKKSSTPLWSREYLKVCYDLALKKDEGSLQKYVDKCKAEFYKMRPDEIAVPRGINNIEKYISDDPNKLFIKGTQAHIKSAIIHNHLIEVKGLKEISPITSGSKIKYVQLVEPNPISQPIIGFDTYMPEEFGLHDYVDYDTVWEKSFVSPLCIFLTAIDWSYEEQIDLFSFS